MTLNSRKRRCPPRCVRIGLICSVVTGIGLFILGIMVLCHFTQIMEDQIREAFILRKCSEAGSRFEDPPYSSLVYVRVFNVTNPDDVNNGKSIPKLAEVGPFAYSLTKRKIVYEWDSEQETVSYREKHIFRFLPELSVGDPKDFTIYHVNGPDVAIANRVAQATSSSLTRWLPIGNLASYYLDLGPLVIRHQANELLFDGYRIAILDTLEKMVTLPKSLPNNTFGVFYGKNDTLGNRITVQTGGRGIRTLGNVVEYNNSRSLPYWVDNSTCSVLNGTDGTYFAPFITKGEPLYAFSPELCRTVKLIYTKTDSVQGIQVHRYQVPEDGTFNSTENICYCTEQEIEKCAKTGVLVVKTCLDDAPVALSPPHFYMSDRCYVDQFIGLSPNREQHDSYADVEPHTGLVLRGKRKLQINFEITPHQSMTFLKNATMRFFPLVWIEEVGEVNNDKASELRWRLTYPMTYGPLVLKLIICLGLLLVLIPSLATVIFLNRARSHSFRKKQLKKDVLLSGLVANGKLLKKGEESNL